MVWHFHWQCHHMREYSWLHMGLVSIHIHSPGLALRPSSPFSPYSQAWKSFRFRWKRLKWRTHMELKIVDQMKFWLRSSWQPKNLKLWLEQKALQAVWLPLSVALSGIAPSDSKMKCLIEKYTPVRCLLSCYRSTGMINPAPARFATDS